MRIKAGVNLTGLRPELIIAVMAADQVWSRQGQELVITSMVDGKHGVGSFHYQGGAVDLRTRYFSDEEREAAAYHLRMALGEQFDVIDEGDHIHVEYHPKGR